jgi:peptidoglycan/LPS O-acetylase OafA/YrhL
MMKINLRLPARVWWGILTLILLGASAYAFSRLESVVGAYDWSIRLIIAAIVPLCFAVWPKAAVAISNLLTRNVYPRLAKWAIAKESPRPNWGLLGVMRFVLALSVVLTHINLVPHENILAAGRFAVIGFLLISGYSIAHSLQSQREGYFIRRAWRIYPVYITVLLLAIACGGWKLGVWTWVGCFFMLQQILFQVPDVIIPTWTLGGEWWCYVIGYWLNVRRAWLLLLLFLPIAFYGMVTTENIAFVWWKTVPYLGVAWICGYLLYHGRRAVIIPLVIFMTEQFHATTMQAGAPMWAGLLWVYGTLAILLFMPSLKVKAGKLLGDTSYPLYLIHVPLIYVFGVYGALISIPAAWAVNRFIEQPLSSLRKTKSS